MTDEAQRIAIRKCYANLCYAEFVLKMLDWQAEMSGNLPPKRVYKGYQTVVREANALISANLDVLNVVTRMNCEAYFSGYWPHNA